MRIRVLSCVAVLAFCACSDDADYVAGGSAAGGAGAAAAKAGGDAAGGSGATGSTACGDGVVDSGEVCDDGNTAGGDGCSATCASDESCGNGVLDSDAGELCDDGNTSGDDGCPATCIAAPAIVAGAKHTCALSGRGLVKCWGRNAAGQLGLGDRETRGEEVGEMGSNLPVVDLGPGRVAVALVAGGSHVCAVLDDGTVKCWGNNITGQLGLGDRVSRGRDVGEMGSNLPVVDLGPGRTAVALAAGSSHTCAILDDGSVKCWGNNGAGQLGVGDSAHRGGEPGEMGGNLPVVDLGLGRTALSFAAGSGHTCAILDDKTLKCWGYNSGGQLGLGDIDTRGDGADEMGDNLPVVDLGSGRGAVSLALGGTHTCAVLDDGTVKCWGQGSSGRLGSGQPTYWGDQPDEMGDNLPVVALGLSRTATSLAAGGEHTCAVLDDASVKCWGGNRFGQLGLGDASDRGDQAEEMGDKLPAVNLGPGARALTAVAGQYHTCALLDDNTLKCWGNNAHAQLGLGDPYQRGDDADEMGAKLPAIDLWP